MSDPQKFYRHKNMLKVLYHHAKFAGAQTSHAAGATKNVETDKSDITCTVHHLLSRNLMCGQAHLECLLCDGHAAFSVYGCCYQLSVYSSQLSVHTYHIYYTVPYLPQHLKSRSVQPFLQGSVLTDTNIQTDICYV